MNESWQPASAAEINTPIDYYAYPAVSQALLKFWGCPAENCAGISLPNPQADRCLQNCSVEYLAVTSMRIARDKSGGVPVRSIPREDLPTQFQRELNAGDGGLEINQPLGYFCAPDELAGLPRDARVPERTLLFLDFELFNEGDATWPFKYPHLAFQHLDATYQTLTTYFADQGIDALVAMSGRGYHFICHIPYNSPAMGRLIDLGHNLSPEVAHFLDHPRPGSKRTEPIPRNTERAFWGARQLEYFIYAETIRSTRSRSDIPVEISNRGRFGISFDPTSMNRTTETAGFGTPASLYTKPHVKYRIEGRYLTRVIRAVIRDGQRHEFGDLEQMLGVRENYRQAAANIDWLMEYSPAGIPNGSEGIQRLLDQYQQSQLASFHDVMNQHYRLDGQQWQELVADLGRAALEDPRIGNATAQPYPALLDPDSLNSFIFGLFQRWRPQHGLHAFKRAEFVLSAFYYNEPTILQQFGYEPINWGKTFNHEVPQRHAQGWVMMLGGQLFERD